MARTRLFKRLPDAWRRYDTDGVLERYLGVLDAGFDKSHDLARAVLDFRSVDSVPDRYLALLGDIVGHQWRSDRTHDWNRSRIRDAVKRYSYKGTVESIKDLVAEHGGGPWEIIDMASTLLVWNRQGRLSRGDSHTLAADFYHPGAYLLKLTTQVNLTEFSKDFELVKAAGEVWFFELSHNATVVTDDALVSGMELDDGISEGAFGRYNNDLFLNFRPAIPCDFVFLPIFYLNSEINRFDDDPFLNFQPAGPSDFAFLPILYVDSSIADYGRYNEDLFLSGQNAGPAELEVEQTGRSVSGGSLTMDGVIRMSRTDITMSMGTPANPLPEEMAIQQEPIELTLEAI